jgi:multimeric flavodoxin WrbA
LILNCGQKNDNTQVLTDYVAASLVEHAVAVESVRVADRVAPEGEAGWPDLRAKVLAADILVLVTPARLGQPAPIAWQVLDRLGASEVDGKVAGVAVTGAEDGAREVACEVAGALDDRGHTVPDQAWTHWDLGTAQQWENTAVTMAAGLVAAAAARHECAVPA